ncbi:MAG: glutamate racemase [Desulfobacca sp.]|uniref:glutamate racemase n=1 Tax=Desulfobacca sp. TaxID=2067990 RepID=UPI004049C353
MIGVFDSGFGGLAVLREFLAALPEYDYLYLGDNARIPYGTRSDAVVLKFTQQAVAYLFAQGCVLIILACHTASAKALRTIQQQYLPFHYRDNRVLGVVIPTVEEALARSVSKRIGVIATEGTVASNSFKIELRKLDPMVQVFQQACPLLVPIIECGEQDGEVADLMLRKYLSPLLAQQIDTLILGCTHYSILKPKIQAMVYPGVQIICSGEVTAIKLADYLRRHPEIDRRLNRSGRRRYLTTDLTPRFRELASLFMGQEIEAEVIQL